MRDWLIYVCLILVALVVLYFGLKAAWKNLRRRGLMTQYGDAEMVDAIMDKRLLRGMSLDMVLSAWGTPADLDETVMKTKTKHEMKYNQTGKNRFGTRVYLENGVVVGWETK